MRKKFKILSMWMLGIGFFFVASATVYAQNTYTVPTLEVVSGDVQAGDNVEVNVVMHNNPGIVSMQLDVVYDSAVLKLVDKKDGGMIGSAVHSDNLLLCPYRLTWANDLSTTNYTGNGTIITLTFAVAEDARAGKYPVTVSYTRNNFEIFDCNANEVDFEIVAGNITVNEAECTHKDKCEVASIKPDCVNAGNNKYYVCDSCGLVFKADGITQTTVADETLVALGHDWNEQIQDGEHLRSFGANCKENHTYWYDCTRCNEVSDTKYYFGTEFGEHEYSSEWSQGDADGHWHDCLYCSAHDVPIAHVPGTEATEEEPQICTVCSYVITPAIGHVHKTVKMEAIKATCTEDGQKSYYVCGCGAWFEDEDSFNEILDKNDVIVGALGHDLSDATCTEAAYCKRERCNYIEGEPLGHVESEWLYDGEKHWKVCKNSGCDTEIAGSRELHTDSGKCSICGYTASVAHVHSFGIKWECDEDFHWNKCACGQVNNVEAHVDGNEDKRCDKCNWGMAIVEEVKSPKTDDYTNVFLLGVLLISCISLPIIKMKKGRGDKA